MTYLPNDIARCAGAHKPECEDCLRNIKLSAAMWRNKAYELGGTPLPWDADKKIEEAIAAEREACAKVCDAAAKKMDDEGEGPTGYIAWVTDCAAAIRARGNK